MQTFPAGYDLDNKVFADGRYRFEESGEPLELTNMKWPEVLVAEILKACKPEFGLAILQFWYGDKRVAKAIGENRGKIGIAGSIIGVGLGGATIGAGIGAVGGPLAMPIGAAVGLAVGIISSALVTTGAVAFLNRKAIKSASKSGENAEEPIQEEQNNSIPSGAQDSSK